MAKATTPNVNAHLLNENSAHSLFNASQNQASNNRLRADSTLNRGMFNVSFLISNLFLGR